MSFVDLFFFLPRNDVGVISTKKNKSAFVKTTSEAVFLVVCDPSMNEL
jgi:hypothetical protein